MSNDQQHSRMNRNRSVSAFLLSTICISLLFVFLFTTLISNSRTSSSCRSSPALVNRSQKIFILRQQDDSAEQALGQAGQLVNSAFEDAYQDARSILNKHKTIVIAILIPVSLLACFLGYIVRIPFLFIGGFLVGGFTSYTVTHALTASSPNLAWVSITAMAVGGIFTGLIAIWLVKVGIFAIGAIFGAALAIAFRTIILSNSAQNGTIIFYCFLIGLAILYGCLALCLEKPMLVISTGFGGSYGVVYGMGFFVGHFPDFLKLQKDFIRDKWVWAYFMGFVVLGVCGIIVQFRVINGYWMFGGTRGSDSGSGRTSSRSRRRRATEEDRQKLVPNGQNLPIIVPFSQENPYIADPRPIDVRITMDSQPPASGSVRMPPKEKRRRSRSWKKSFQRSNSKNGQASEDAFAYDQDDESVDEFRTEEYDEYERKVMEQESESSKK
mmetsp:Transcript_5209/g.9092  ORF Transcript_5209/g.9092 Transcript_5209/m.9092 type:complete len:440 (-) Transcript_5209:60-1379(-)